MCVALQAEQEEQFKYWLPEKQKQARKLYKLIRESGGFHNKSYKDNLYQIIQRKQALLRISEAIWGRPQERKLLWLIFTHKKSTLSKQKIVHRYTNIWIFSASHSMGNSSTKID